LGAYAEGMFWRRFKANDGGGNHFFIALTVHDDMIK
jgi:hypothetical protein